MTFAQLFLRHALASFDKQVYLQAMHGRHTWELRVDAGSLAFSGPHGGREEYRVQFLGTASDTEGTWRWAWASPDTFVDPAGLACAREAREYGEAHAVAELSAPVLLLGAIGALPRVMVCDGLCRAGAWFRCAYPQGVLYVLIKDPRFKRPVQHPLARIARIVPLFLAEFPVADAQTAFEHYLGFYRLTPMVDQRADGARITVRGRDAPEPAGPLSVVASDPRPLTADFDARRRLMRIGLER